MQHIDYDDFIIKESTRKKNSKVYVDRRKYYRSYCTSCYKDRGYQDKSRAVKKPMCVTCATNTDQHKEKLRRNHWSRTNTYRTPKIYITAEQISNKKAQELAYNREYYKTYYQKNKTNIHNKRKLYLKNNQYAKIASAIRTRMYQSIKGNRSFKLSGCSKYKLAIHLQMKWYRRRSNGELMSWDNYGEWHIDHIRPLASFNLEDKEELRAACHYTNLQPLWAEDNLKKGSDLLYPITQEDE